MKIAALITVAALTCGAALAQGYGSSTDRDTSANRGNSAAATTNDSQPKGEGIMDKTKRAFHRLGEKLRGAGHTAKKSTDKDTDKTAQQSDTRTMGASGSDKSGSAPQSRMDQAYANSQKSKSMDK